MCELEAGNSASLGVCCQERTENAGNANFAAQNVQTPEVEVEDVSVEDVNDFIGVRFVTKSSYVW